jgi:hypothetical protein
MKAGDVIFESKSSNLVSKVIAVADGLLHLQGPTEFSHVAIAIGGNLIFEADDNVCLSNVLANNVDCREKPRRFKQGFKYKGPVEESVIIASLLESAQYFLFQDYSYLKMFNVLESEAVRELENDDFQGMFCSSLVQTILHNARLISDQNSMPDLTPEGLRRHLANSNEWERFDLPDDYFDDPFHTGRLLRSHIEKRALGLFETFKPVLQPLAELVNKQLELIVLGDQVEWPVKAKNEHDVTVVVARFSLNLDALKNTLTLIRLLSTIDDDPSWVVKQAKFGSRYVWVAKSLAGRVCADCDYLEAASEIGLIVAPATDDNWQSVLREFVNIFEQEEWTQIAGYVPGASLPDVTRKLRGLITRDTSSEVSDSRGPTAET